MNENNEIVCQRRRKIQDDVESITEVSRLQVGRSRGDKHGGDSRSESGRNLTKAEPCTAIETRAGDISAGKVGRGDLRGLDQNRKEEIEAWN